MTNTVYSVEVSLHKIFLSRIIFHLNPFYTENSFSEHIPSGQSQFRQRKKKVFDQDLYCLEEGIFYIKYSKSENIHQKPLKLQMDSSK